ncbi:MAG: GNAT family N-acetyltransferase [Nanoarchaeota archaeon]
MTIIKTKEFILRPITLGDAQGYLECHQDKEAKRNFMSVPKNLKEAEEEINGSIKKGLTWVIEVNKKFAGFVHLELNNNPKYKHSALVGFGIHPNFRGKGLATKSLKSITNYGFKKLNLVRISGMCRTFNKASAKVMEKAGYKLEGILRKNKFKDGKYLDDMIWAKVK